MTDFRLAVVNTYRSANDLVTACKRSRNSAWRSPSSMLDVAAHMAVIRRAGAPVVKGRW